MKYRCLLILLFIFPITAQANKAFTSKESFSKWLAYYYQKPEPDKVTSAVRYMSKEGMLNKRSTIPPIFGFLSGIFKDNPKKAFAWAEELKDINQTHYGVVVLGLWYSKIPKSKEYVFKLIDENKVLNKNFAYLKKGNPMFVHDIPLEQGTWVLDALWGEFSATGKAKPVARIAEALPWFDIKGDTSRLMVGGAANWSLKSNAIQHNRVFNIINELNEKDPSNKYLTKAINEAKNHKK